MGGLDEFPVLEISFLVGFWDESSVGLIWLLVWVILLHSQISKSRW